MTWEGLNRRRFPRVKFPCLVKVIVNGVVFETHLTHTENISIGGEAQVYYNDLHQRGVPVVHSIQTEQKIFLLFYLEDSQRRGYYN